MGCENGTEGGPIESCNAGSAKAIEPREGLQVIDFQLIQFTLGVVFFLVPVVTSCHMYSHVAFDVF